MTEPKMLQSYDAVYAHVDVDDAEKTARLHFQAEGRTPLVVTVHLRTLEMLRDRINEVLAASTSPAVMATV